MRCCATPRSGVIWVMIDEAESKTYLTSMNAQTKLSAKGQVVIPKEVRDALGWAEGQKLRVTQAGGKAVLEAAEPQRERISWEEFRRRVPGYSGPPVSIEEMDVAVARMWSERAGRTV